MSSDPDNTKPRQIMTPEEIAARNRRIADAVRAGVPMREVRSRFGLGEDGLRRVLADMGVAQPRGGRKWA